MRLDGHRSPRPANGAHRIIALTTSHGKVPRRRRCLLAVTRPRVVDKTNELRRLSDVHAGEQIALVDVECPFVLTDLHCLIEGGGVAPEHLPIEADLFLPTIQDYAFTELIAEHVEGLA